MTKRFVDWKLKNEKQREAAVKRLIEVRREARWAKLFDLGRPLTEDEEYTRDVYELISRSL